jgi:cell shape-determining protein MreD
VRTLAYIALLFAAAVVESTLPRMAGLTLMRPLLVVALVLHFALRLNTIEGAVLSFVGGFLMDATAGYPTGFGTFAAVATFVGVRVGLTGLRADGALFESGFAFVLVLLWHTLTIVVQRQLGPEQAPLADVPWLAMSGWSALATAMAMPLVTRVARRVDKLEKRPAGWL